MVNMYLNDMIASMTLGQRIALRTFILVFIYHKAELQRTLPLHTSIL
jgi:hypothetical protein